MAGAASGLVIAAANRDRASAGESGSRSRYPSINICWRSAGIAPSAKHSRTAAQEAARQERLTALIDGRVAEDQFRPRSADEVGGTGTVPHRGGRPGPGAERRRRGGFAGRRRPGARAAVPAGESSARPGQVRTGSHSRDAVRPLPGRSGFGRPTARTAARDRGCQGRQPAKIQAAGQRLTFPFGHRRPQCGQGVPVPGLLAGRGFQSGVAGELANRGGELRGRGLDGEPVPGLKESFEKRPAFGRQPGLPQAAGLLGPFVLEALRRGLRPDADGPEVRFPVPRLAEQPQQALRPARGVARALRPRGAEVGAAEQCRQPVERPPVVRQPRAPATGCRPPGSARSVRPRPARRAARTRLTLRRADPTNRSDRGR